MTDIGDFAFEGCLSLISVVIPDGVSSINEGLFWDCISLSSVTLPASVKDIEDYAFAGCTNLTEFYSLAEDCPTVSVETFEETPIEGVALYVPEASVVKYELDEVWGLFGSVNAIGGGVEVAPNKDAETAIDNLKGDAKIVSVYNLGGQQNARMQRGINIVRMSDGTTRKVLKQ